MELKKIKLVSAMLKMIIPALVVVAVFLLGHGLKVSAETYDNAELIQNGESKGTYATVSAAITAAGTEPSEIKLLGIAHEKITIAAGQSITLDLNGETLYYSNEDFEDAVITNYGTFRLITRVKADANISSGYNATIKTMGGGKSYIGSGIDENLNDIWFNTAKGFCFSPASEGKCTVYGGVFNASNWQEGSTVIENSGQKIYDIEICGGEYSDESVENYLTPGTYLEQNDTQGKTYYKVKYKPTMDMPQNVAITCKDGKCFLSWDPTTDESLDHYEVWATWEKDGVEIESDHIEVAPSEDTMCDFTKFINSEGDYSFFVKCVAKADAEKYDSLAICLARKFYGLTVKQRIKDGDSTSVGMAGTVKCTVKDYLAKDKYFEDEVDNDTPTMYFPVNSRVTLEATAGISYTFNEFRFELPKPDSVVANNNIVNFVIDKSVNVSSDFKKGTTFATINVQIGAGHEELASKVAAFILEDETYDTKDEASAEGSVVTFKFPAVAKEKDVLDYVTNMIKGAMTTPEKAEYVDNAEQFYEGAGFKSLQDYENEGELIDAISEAARADIDPEITVYALWEKPVPETEFEIKVPECGTEVVVKAEEYSYASQTNHPEISGPDSNKLVMINPYDGSESNYSRWVNYSLPIHLYEQTDEDLYNGIMTGDNTYNASLCLAPKFGYYIFEDAVIKVNGATVHTYMSYNKFAVILDVKVEHVWDEGVVTKEPTVDAEGVLTYTCSGCKSEKTEPIPKKEDKKDDKKDDNKEDNKSEDSEKKTPPEEITEKDPAESTFAPLMLKSSKQTKSSVTINWKQVKGASKYIIYGSKCGKTIKMKKLAESSGKSMTFKKIDNVKVKKGTYYKFIVYAEDNDGNILATSKVLHIASKGGKFTNAKKVIVKKGKKTVSKVTLKKGKSVKLKSSVILASKKLKSKTHRKISYESSNPEVAIVSSKGVVKGLKKGTCYIYAYAQNGTYKKVKVKITK